MIIPDANLLIYAYDSTVPAHADARAWWGGVLAGTEPVGIPVAVLLAFTRLMTHPTICQNPLSTEQVRAIVYQWLAQPQVRWLNPSAAFHTTFFDLLDQSGTGGNLCTDALIALAAREYSGTVFSNDHDFGRFPGLKWINPLA